MKRHKLRTCPCLRSQLHTNVFGNLVVAQQTYAEVKEASMFCREESSEEEVEVPDEPRTRRVARRAPRREFRRTLSDEVIREHPDEAEARPAPTTATWSAREEREFLAKEDAIGEEDAWSARVGQELLRRGRKNTYHGAQLSRGSSIEEEAGRRRSTTDLHDAGRRRVSELVDELLLDIYGRCGRRTSAGSSAFESDCCSVSAASSWCWRTEGYRPGQDGVTRAAVSSKSVPELRAVLVTLRMDVQMAGARLVRQLKRRDRMKARQAIQNSVVTAYLQAVSEKRSEDAKMRFSVVPFPGDSGFSQWHDAMKMVARLPGGIPPDFRRRLWLTLAERHLQDRGVDWAKMQRFCFNEWTNPDDDELGVQIVKDLHRTGCSLFCGAAAEENQALLKRVLLAYARWNKAVGYCQGFNMLAALILQVMDRSESDAVKVMIHLIEGVLPESYFANNLRGLSVDMAVFRDLLRLRLPALSRHLEQLQHEAGDSATGTSYEPPLTNVFTMQWFLTLFSNCLPQATVLRVWDLIFLEGNEVLLRTALAIWDGLADRIMAVESADEFYSIMGVLTREMLEFGLMDANHLIKTVVAIAPFPYPELPELRDKYLYNITPWTQTVSTAARRGLRLFYSDDDDDTDEDDEKMAVAAAYGISAVFRSPRRRDSVSRAPSPTTSLSTLSYGCGAPDRDRLALDISALKQQYAKLRERQRQAHIILTAACSRQSLGPSAPTPVAMNHLLLGKNALLSARGRRMGPLAGAVPPLRPAPQGRLLAATSKALHADRKPRPGETLHWKDAAKRRLKKTDDDDGGREAPAEGAADERAALEVRDDDPSHDSSGDESSSSTSTELCDEPDRLSDFDSEEPTSVSDASSYIPPPENLLKIPSPSTDVSSSPSPDLCSPTFAFRIHPPLTDDVPDPRTDNRTIAADAEATVIPNDTVPCEITSFQSPNLDLPLRATDCSTADNVVSSPSDSGREQLSSSSSTVLEYVGSTIEVPIPLVSIEDADDVRAESTLSQRYAITDDDETICNPYGETEGAGKHHHIYHRGTRGLTNIMNEISNLSEVGDVRLERKKISGDEHYIGEDVDLNSSPISSHEQFCKQLIATSPSDTIEDQNSAVVGNFVNEDQEIGEGPADSSPLSTSEPFKGTESYHSRVSVPLSSPNENLILQKIANYNSDINCKYEKGKSVDSSIATERSGEGVVCKSAEMDESTAESRFSDIDHYDNTHTPVTVVIQSRRAESHGELFEGAEECPLSNVGRRKSERALKIIQENFEILQRITQCHGRHSDRLLEETKTCNGDGSDVCDDAKSSGSDQSADSLRLVPANDNMSGNTSPQIDLPVSMTDGEDSFRGIAAERPTSATSQPEKFEFINSSLGRNSSAEVSDLAEAKLKPQSNKYFKDRETGNRVKHIIILESENVEDKQRTFSEFKAPSTITPWSEIQLDFPLNNDEDFINGKRAVRVDVQGDLDVESKYLNFSRKSAIILEGNDSSLRRPEDYPPISHCDDPVSPKSTAAESSVKLRSDYFTTSGQTVRNGKSPASHPFTRFDDRRRSTIHTFDSNDRDALRSFNTSFVKKPDPTPEEDVVLEKYVPLTTSERLACTSRDEDLAKDAHWESVPSIRSVDTKSYNFVVKDDVTRETQDSLTSRNSYPSPGSYSFHPLAKYSSEIYPRDFDLQDQKRWSTGALCSGEVWRADSRGSAKVSACAAAKSQLSLALGAGEPREQPPVGQRPAERPLGSDPRTVSSRTPTDSVPNESAYVVDSPAAPQKLFPYSSRSGQVKSPAKGKDVVSPLAPVRTPIVGSPTRNCKKYDPFPPRAGLRQPKEVGIKLGLYSATSEADRKNSSKKP